MEEARDSARILEKASGRFVLKHAWFSFPMHNLVFIVAPLSEPGIAS